VDLFRCFWIESGIFQKVVNDVQQGFEGKRAVGIEPTTTAWKAVVLPLNYARVWGEVNSPLRYNSISRTDDQYLSIDKST
jgi:hypothetical protein